ncbi:Hermansky-Pudlak syndrome 1 [Amphibalanus amphitrite]|uniref:Hermansky-Pudlak syndrome 1 n=1 Tax=Amphibalanus amphitrite TaxID=1232801 RepID=A0A6A4VJ10_AMPAM|nr:Hermansky-Pudlak syndrome 1 [Amphibalanus amphitrite]
MLGVIIFDRLNDVMFSHGDDKFEEHIRCMAARNGLFYPAYSDTMPETRGERADVLLQLFSPFLASQRIMAMEFRDPYSEVECEDGLVMVFHEVEFGDGLVMVFHEVSEVLTREQFRDFVTTELNRPTSVGRVSRLLKKWEGAVDDDHREGEAMRIGDRLLVTAEEKANAFAAQYAHVSRQVGFRAKRSAEDSIGRLVQNVQDGWQRPKYDRRAERPDGSTAQKYLLTAYDFSRAYDVVDHKLLKLRLLELGLPLCLVRWVWSWLRDRRVRVEVQGALSKERIFRAGLPQGSVLSPQLFLLWAAGLAEALRAPGISPYIYADDTAVLSSGNTLETAIQRAQTAADALAAWAHRNKMLVAGEKTQLLVLSQNAKDAVGCTIKVSGKTVRAGDSLVLLGIEFDRRLQFGAHCRRLRRRVRPRVAHLRRLAGRSWGLDEQALRTVANGYVRGALEHAAAAWLPATAPSHAELIEREMRAAARIVTGCPRSTPTHAVMAEARLAPMEERKKVLAARLLGRALALPPTDPLRRTAEASAPSRLSSVRGWRTLGRQMLAEVEVTAPIEPVLPPRIPPWERGGNVTFCLDVGPLRTGATEGEKIRAATRHLAALPQRATWLWTDGSVEGGVKDGGSGAVVIWSDGEEEDLKTPAGRHCSSYRAEMLALASGLEHLLDNPRDRDIPIYLTYQCLCLSRHSTLSPRKYVSAAVSLAKLLCGPVLSSLPSGSRSHAFLTVEGTLVSLYSGRHVAELSPAAVLSLLVLVHAVTPRAGTAGTDSSGDPEVSSGGGPASDPDGGSGGRADSQVHEELCFLSASRSPLSPYLVYVVHIWSGTALVIVSDLCMTDVSGGLCEAIESLARYQQAVTPFQRDQVYAHLKHGLMALFSCAKQIRHSPEVRSLLSRLQSQWDQLRRLRVDAALCSGRPVPPPVDQGLATLSRTLEAAFEAVCHVLPERATLPAGQLLQRAETVQRELSDYRSFLLARAVSNATVETRSHLNISRYLDNFPDLVHFIYVDRSVHLMTAPSTRPPDGRHDLTDTVRKMIDLAYQYLREGHMSIIWRDQRYSYGHFLWFEDAMGNPQKARESPRRLKALYADWQPGILARDYFSALVAVCFPEAAPEEVRCYQLFLVHRGPVQSDRVLQQSQQIAKTVWEVSGAAATPLDLL